VGVKGQLPTNRANERPHGGLRHLRALFNELSVVVLLAGALTTIVTTASVVALGPGTSGAATPTWNPSTAPTTGLDPAAVTGTEYSGIHVNGVSCAAANSDRLGLASMRERAEVMGATLEVQSAPGQGTTVEVLWP
jgi:hypothetical protein